MKKEIKKHLKKLATHLAILAPIVMAYELADSWPYFLGAGIASGMIFDWFYPKTN